MDFIVAERVAVELKSQKVISDKLLRGLRALQEENMLERYILVANIERKRTMDAIEIFPLRDFLESLWSHQIV